MKYLSIFIAVFIISSTFLRASDVEERRQAIVEIIDEELKEVRGLSKQYDNKNPELLLRAAELNLEKARLFRDKENEEFLSLSAAKRRKINKRGYFKRSQNYLDQATKISANVIKKFPRYKNISDAYYIIGYNYKEANDSKRANKYLTLARKKNPRNDQTKVKSQIAQAEIYYNDRQYRKAIPLYEQSLSQLKDRWWTKDTFNLAWCYYRSGRFDKAIDKMNEVYKRSKDKKYIDMSDQVVRDIGLFYADAGQIKEGIRFYEDLNVDFTKEIVIIGKKLKADGQYTKAEKIFNIALKYEKDDSKRIDIQLELLETYDRHGKDKSHLSTTISLLKTYKENKFNAEQKKKYVYFLEKESASLQKLVASKAYARLGQVRTAKGVRANQYFGILAQIQPEKAGEIYFLQGETSFASAQYLSALGFYNKSFELKENHPFKKRALDAMMATLSKKSIPAKTKEQYYDKVYSEYLKVDNTSEKSKKIYMKLFNVRFNRGDLKGSKEVLDDFTKHNKKDFKNQEIMIARIMEYHRKKKNNDAVIGWVEAINNKEYVVSNKYANKLRELLTAMQMEKVQNSLEKGEKLFALKGYHSILEDESSTIKSKKNSTYNIAILYFELEREKLAYDWGQKAMKMMSSNEVIKFYDSFLAISNLLFEKRYFSESSKFSEEILEHICKDKNARKNRVFRNAAILAVTANELNRAESLLAKADQCDIQDETKTEVRKELAKYYRENKRWKDLELTLAKIDNNVKEAGYSIIEWHAMKEVYESYSVNERAGKVNDKIISLYRNAKAKKVDMPLEALDIVAAIEIEDIKKQAMQVDQIALSFPEKTYDKLIESRLKKLDSLTKNVASLKNIGSGEGIVKGYLILIDSYEKLAKDISDFTPPGKSENYIKSFKGAMAGIVGPINNTARKYRSEIFDTINKNSILSRANAEIMSDEITFRYLPESKEFLMMDRRGKH